MRLAWPTDIQNVIIQFVITVSTCKTAIIHVISKKNNTFFDRMSALEKGRSFLLCTKFT
ncbi:hypothetical protein BACCAP_02055 [Pseudoflavonifractor capillosus ATCC 29799]|uniref:Uncharacterized protein n=1 Tax=Pseudoflavonifractor capillosus ATCC 29799 TaxID=411467 RepID=A6NV20_9FIRM|nr:hypothetical protein BACCAP_02055 [Pseudoflavonifractor capillosus ATCC 29799]